MEISKEDLAHRIEETIADLDELDPEWRLGLAWCHSACSSDLDVEILALVAQLDTFLYVRDGGDYRQFIPNPPRVITGLTVTEGLSLYGLGPDD